MLKRVFVLSLIFLLVFCGCSNKKTVNPVLEGITFLAVIDYKNENFICEAETDKSYLKLCVIEPQIISGLTFVFDKNTAKVEFKDISSKIYTEYYELKIIKAIFDDISVGPKLKLNKNNCEINKKINGYTYSFTFSPTGLPIKLTIDDIKLNINFKNVTINDKSEG